MQFLKNPLTSYFKIQQQNRLARQNTKECKAKQKKNQLCVIYFVNSGNEFEFYTILKTPQVLLGQVRCCSRNFLYYYFIFLNIQSSGFGSNGDTIIPLQGRLKFYIYCRRNRGLNCILEISLKRIRSSISFSHKLAMFALKSKLKSKNLLKNIEKE